MSISTNTINGSLENVLAGKGCWNYNIKIGPLTQKEADGINTFKGQLSNGISTATGIGVGMLIRSGQVATASSAAIAMIMTQLSKNLHQGDMILQNVKTCPSKTSDSGVETEVAIKIIKKSN